MIGKRQVIIIKNFFNVNIFVQHNFKIVLIRILHWGGDS
jgi:hypothetical protein